MSGLPSKDIIFEEALGKSTPEERASYLEEVCRGDSTLRNRMTRIVEAHLAAGSFLETPVFGSGRPAEIEIGQELRILQESGSWIEGELPPGLISPSDRVGSSGRSGSLEILEVVARGSMGIVL